MSNLDNILSQSACLTKQQMLQYFDKNMEAEEMHIVEEHVTDCMFCSDAFDGLSALSSTEIKSLLLEIKTETEIKIDTHIASIKEEDEEKLVVHSGGKSRKHWVAAASLLLLMFGGGAALFSYFNDHHEKEIKMASNDKPLPTTKEKATIKEGSRELNTISMEPSDFDIKEDEIVAKNDKVEYRKKRSIPLEAETEADDISLAPPSPSPSVISANKTIEKTANNSAVGSSVTKKKVKRDMASQQKAELAKLDVERSAQDFSNMNTATMPKYKGKLKTTPQQNNMYVDRKEKEDQKQQLREASELGDVIVSQQKENKNLYGKDKESLSSFEQGYSLYNQGQYKKSIRLFKKALRKKDVKNAEDIKYYLALALIQEGKEKEADALLAELEKGTRFRESARRKRSSISR